jgi:hypothetical protein
VDDHAMPNGGVIAAKDAPQLDEAEAALRVVREQIPGPRDEQR